MAHSEDDGLSFPLALHGNHFLVLEFPEGTYDDGLTPGNSAGAFDEVWLQVPHAPGVRVPVW